MARESLLKRINRFLILVGIEPLRLIATAPALAVYLRDCRAFQRLQRGRPTVDFPITRWSPMLNERTTSAGTGRGAYFHQDLLVARRIFERRPRKHVDVGSRIDGFVAHVACFREIEVLDIRALPEKIPHVVFRQADFMQETAPLTDYCDSVSCLHALEHFGLGRFGDPLDCDGHLKGFRNLHRIVEPGGACYLSVPLGPQRIEFNAHRVFSLSFLLGMLPGLFRVDRFCYVDDAGELHEDVALTESRIADNCGCTLGCAILELTKLG